MLRRLYNWTMSLADHPRAVPAMATVSFVESSVFPIPADVMFIPMVLKRPDRAMYYALIATIFSVLGGIAGWALGHYAFDLIARPILEFYGKMEAFQRLSGQTGQDAILTMLVTSGLSHLPPMKVVTILSGLISFPLPAFIASAIVARGARFFLLAWLLRRYGAAITAWIERWLGWIALAVGVAMVALLVGARMI